MKVHCTHCRQAADLDNHSAGKTVRCAGCGKSFIAPATLATVGQPHTLAAFPVASLVLLHYVTAGVFSIIYLGLLHERMPRLRRDDPSATVAIGLCFVPIFNLYWIFFNFHRLCVRINEQRRFAGLRPNAPQWLAIPVGVFFACGMAASFFTASGLNVWGAIGAVVMPVFAALVQQSVNGLVGRQSAEPSPAT
jgi:hypothetical protein